MSLHPRFKSPPLLRDPHHSSQPQQPSDKYDPSELPAKVDLRPHMPPVVNQGEVGSCTANALAAAYGYLEGRAAKTQVAVSRLFVYYNERTIEGTIGEDAGACLSDGVKVLKKWGACVEDTWPYDETKWKLKPHAAAYDEGKGHEIDQAATVAVDLHAMKHCLAEGYPFVFGLTIDDFEPDAKGMVKRPAADASDLGGHAICCVGYDDAKKAFIVRNSWGEDWGVKGYCYVPYDWMTDPEATHDAWTLRRGTDLDFSQVGATTDDDAEDDDDSDDDDADDDSDEADDDDDSDDADDSDDSDDADDADDADATNTAKKVAPKAKKAAVIKKK